LHLQGPPCMLQGVIHTGILRLAPKSPHKEGGRRTNHFRQKELRLAKVRDDYVSITILL
jgi:hypothetical protein